MELTPKIANIEISRKKLRQIRWTAIKTKFNKAFRAERKKDVLSMVYLCLCFTLHKKMKFSSNEFFSRCHQICSFLRIWSHLLKTSLMEKFIFCSVLYLTAICFNCHASCFILKNYSHALYLNTFTSPIK